jgi:putative ABC transport system permease protein
MVALILSYFLFTLVKNEFLALLVDSSVLELDPDLKTIGLFIAFALLVGFSAGIVPALYFARLNPVQALKSKFNTRSSRFSFRKILTVAQFALSLGFIMGVVIIFGQYKRTLSYDFGFNKENVLNVHLKNVDPEIFKNEFSQLPEVTRISMSSNALGSSGTSSVWIRNTDDMDSIEVNQMYVDESFIENHGLKMVQGENFNSISASTQYVIVNEQFIKQYSDKNESTILGKTFLANDTMLLTVKGVVQDFHYAHLTEPIKPFFFRYDASQYSIANVRLSTNEDIFTTISKMEAVWKKIEPHEKFEAKFLADEINDAYDFYFSLIKICGYLGLLAITISCLGMLGMVVFTVENKIKEIGVRKVMGASTLSITYILSRDFMKLLLIAAMIATPITYYLFDQYLQRQYFKLGIGIAEILFSLVLVMGLGLAAILTQTWRAARANPVDSLRTE